MTTISNIYIISNVPPSLGSPAEPKPKDRKKSLAGKKGGKKGGKEKKIRMDTGVITGRAMGGTLPVPTVCPRCWEVQPSAIAAKMHCRRPYKPRLVNSNRVMLDRIRYKKPAK